MLTRAEKGGTINGRFGTVHVAWTTTNEYGAHGSIVGVFLTKQEAEKASQGVGWFGGQGAVTTSRALILDNDTVYLISNTEPFPIGVNLPEAQKALCQQAKEKLLAALRPEELAALDIKV